MSFLAVIAFFVNGLRTDRRTDGWTDKASYRDAWTHLKNDLGSSYPYSMTKEKFMKCITFLFIRPLPFFQQKKCFFGHPVLKHNLKHISEPDHEAHWSSSDNVFSNSKHPWGHPLFHLVSIYVSFDKCQLSIRIFFLNEKMTRHDTTRGVSSKTRHNTTFGVFLAIQSDTTLHPNLQTRRTLAMSKLRGFRGRMGLCLRFIPKVIWAFLHILA